MVDPNFAEFYNWLQHRNRRRKTVSGAVAGMAAGAGMGGAKVGTNRDGIYQAAIHHVLYFNKVT